VLEALRRRLPHARLVYLGDVAYAPYGERSAADVIQRCHRVVAHLASVGARVIVVACNTATVLGIHDLRQRWPDLTFVGVEPGVKPAALRTTTRRIAVMATSATSGSARLRHLIAEFAPGMHVHIQPCPGLADLIERGARDGPELHATLAPLCDGVRAADVDTVVLGCTHYPFVAEAIQTLMGRDVVLIDTAAAVAERVATLRDAVDGECASLSVLSTGESAAMAALLTRCRNLEQVRIEPASI